MQIFLDESGDLGWTFNKPNRAGGSSRFITIAGIVIDEAHSKYLKRHISDIYKKYNLTPKIEKKGCNFSDEHATYIATSLSKLIAKAPSLKIISITANKLNVVEKLRKDCNIFYNYMLGELLPDAFKNHKEVNLILDKRTIKVDHGNNFEGYIKTKCWGELSMDIDIGCQYDSSDQNEGIWLADWMANWIWRRYEDNDTAAYEVIRRLAVENFVEKTLFISK